MGAVAGSRHQLSLVNAAIISWGLGQGECGPIRGAYILLGGLQQR